MENEEHEQTINTKHYEMNFVLILEEMVCGHLKRIAREYEYEF